MILATGGAKVCATVQLHCQEKIKLNKSKVESMTENLFFDNIKNLLFHFPGSFL
jgi:hypothetical protein